jgi:glycosyltransferase involved in cell wall biosynthesis
VPDEYLLTVGSLDPRKNVARLVSAYEQACDRVTLPPLLVVGGGGVAFAKAAIRQTSGVRFLGRVSDRDLIRLYSGARGVVNVSVYEGFGLTVAEAARFGVPMLVSDIAAHRELLSRHPGSLWVDPWDTTDIEEGLVRLSRADPAQHEVVGHTWAEAGAEYGRLLDAMRRD